MTTVTAQPTDTEPGASPPPSRLDRPLAAVAGILGAGVALSVGELFSGFSESVPSLVVGVAEAVVDSKNVPTWVRRWSIDTLGTSQKPALIAGVTVVSVLLGAVVGILARKPARRWIVPVVFALFALIGAIASSDNPLISDGWAWTTAIVAAVAGAATLHLLLEALARRSPTWGDTKGIAAAVSERRWFLGLAGGTALTALFASGLGSLLRGRGDVGAARQEVAARLGSSTDVASAPLPGSFDDLDGISTLVTPNDDFYRIDTALSVPQVDPANWRLSITGMVEEPFEISFDELVAMDFVTEPVTLSCVSNEVGGRLVGNAVWQGVPLADLLDRAGVRDGATQVVGRSVDGWTAGFPTEVATDGRVAMVAVTMNGEPLPVKHGFPARLVVAGLYGYVSATKWLSEIELTTLEDFDGYWVPRGWSKFGPIKTQSRIDVPRNGRDLVAGAQPIAGVAWAPSRSVEKVEVQVDDGPWREAELSEELSDNSWRQWMLAWDATPGDHRIRVRATDGDGDTQIEDRSSPAPDGATGWHTVSVSVA
ncbi:MAG: molybdopterin-dependent oxidoreductase [Acidimicrobiales bacterium]